MCAYFHQPAFEKALFLLPVERDLLFWTTFRDVLLLPLNSIDHPNDVSIGSRELVIADPSSQALGSRATTEALLTTQQQSPRRWTSARRIHARDAAGTFTHDFQRAFALVRSINACEVAHVLQYPLSKVVSQLLLAARHGMLQMWFTRPCLQCGNFTPQQSSTIAALFEKLRNPTAGSSKEGEKILAPCACCGEPKSVPKNLHEVQCLFAFPSTIVSPAAAPGLSNRCIFSTEAVRRRLTRVFLREQSSTVLSIDLPQGNYTIVCEERDVIANLCVTGDKHFSIRSEKMKRSDAILTLDDHSRHEIAANDSYVDLLIENTSPTACFVSLHAAFDVRVECGGVFPPRFFSAADLLFASSIERGLFSALEPFKAFQLPRHVVLCQWTVSSDNIPAQIAVTTILLYACEEQHGAVVGGTTGGGTIRVVFWRASNALATAAIVAQSIACENFAGDVTVTGTLLEQSQDPNGAAAGLSCGSLLFHAPREFQFDVFGLICKSCAALHRAAENEADADRSAGKNDLVRLGLYSLAGNGQPRSFRNDGGDVMFGNMLSMVVDLTGAIAANYDDGSAGTASRGEYEVPEHATFMTWGSACQKKLAGTARLGETLVPAFYEDDSAQPSSFAEF